MNFFKKDVDIENILMSKKIFSNEQNCESLIDYVHDDYKVKRLQIMPPKPNA